MSDHQSQIHGQPTGFGSGWISSVLGVLLAGAGLRAVLCFRFPGILTMPEALSHDIAWLPVLRGLYTSCL